MREHGRLWLKDGEWRLQCAPHVAMVAKRIFHRIPKGQQGVLTLTNTPATCRDLQWFAQRFPLHIESADELHAGASAYIEHIASLDEILGTGYKPKSFRMAIPARAYQRRAAELFLKQSFLLLADDVGLGKTCSAIAALTDKRTLPAVVVTLAHLPGQWAAEINKFMPKLSVHVVKTGHVCKLTRNGRGPDVVVINYHKLANWSHTLSEYGKTVVFDEIQELRRSSSQRYTAAKHLSHAMQYRLGLSATPIYNMGGEMFNILEMLQPGLLGTHGEFVREWCEGGSDRPDKLRLAAPSAFGSWLHEQHIMLRRTRKGVGRELPGLTRVIQAIDSDAKVLEKVEDAAGELARIILSQDAGARGEKMHAAEEFNNLLRQATGIAKAPSVAAFVKMLLDNGEPVVLYGWHRAVYQIWLSKLKSYNPAMYTGTESPAKKQAERDRFINGETPLLIMSLRAGAGLDGLQKRCRTVVVGELDWSPGVHEQCIGRVNRDGQPDPVAVYFLLAEDGADPIMAETLGLKREQVEGIINPGKPGDDLERLVTDGGSLRRLAEHYLENHRKQKDW